MKSFKLITLIDITETNQYRKEIGKELLRDQQQNFQMLLQTIGLRVNPLYDVPPIPSIIDINPKPHGLRSYSQSHTAVNFGKSYSGKHKIWTFNFNIEYNDGLTDSNGDPVGLLVDDLHLVPFIPNLTETFKYQFSVFDTKSNDFKNTLIYSINTA